MISHKLSKSKAVIRPTLTRVNYISIRNIYNSRPLCMIDDDSSAVEPKYSQRQLLKEETEAPFRKIRIFGYFSIISGAGIGTLVSLTSLIASLSRGRDISEITNNLLINTAIILFCAVLWKRDLGSQQILLERIQKGGNLSKLKLKLNDSDGPSIAKLSDLRRGRGIEKIIVIVIAPLELLRSSMLSALNQGTDLQYNDLLIVPLQISKPLNSNVGSYELSAPSTEALYTDGDLTALAQASAAPFIATAMAVPTWSEVLQKEISVAIKQQADALDKGVTIIIKKNGKVGTRKFGVPIWETLVDDFGSKKELGIDITNV